MSFYEDNKFFIIQKLQVDMAGLSEKEKLEKYEVIKPSVRERIYNSHPKKDSITEDDNVIELKKFYDVQRDFSILKAAPSFPLPSPLP